VLAAASKSSRRKHRDIPSQAIAGRDKLLTEEGKVHHPLQGLRQGVPVAQDCLWGSIFDDLCHRSGGLLIDGGVGHPGFQDPDRARMHSGLLFI
jgi:hypothetical protein